jgi:hypothetical protein
LGISVEKVSGIFRVQTGRLGQPRSPRLGGWETRARFPRSFQP